MLLIVFGEIILKKIFPSMNYIIILFGTATIVAGIIILINPEKVFGLMLRKSELLGLHILAVVVRIILGVALCR